MPKQDDESVYPPFPWQYLNGRMAECEVVIRPQKTGPAVYILERKGNVEETAAYFLHADELDNIINALKAAQSHLQNR